MSAGLRLKNMPSHCPFCASIYAHVPGDVGGTPYGDSFERERRLLGKLVKFRQMRSGACLVRLSSTGGGASMDPWEVQLLAHAARSGVILIHAGLRVCFLFHASAAPLLVGFTCSLKMLCSGRAVGFLLLPGDRLLRLSVARKRMR